MTAFEVVWVLPCLSQEFQDGPRLAQRGQTLVIEYDFESVTGEYAWAGMAFDGVATFRFTDSSLCTADMISAYDRLVLVEESDWAAALRNPEGHQHFLIYFDDIGCYEALAKSFTPPPAPA